MKLFKLSILVFLILLATGCKFNTPTNIPTNNTQDRLTIEDNKIVSAAFKKTKENLAKAKLLSAGWKNDAAFSGYNIKMIPGAGTSDLTETFIFGSPQDADYWWTISIDSAGKYVRAIIPKDDYLGRNLTPIQDDYWKKSYYEALNAAELDGGITFRAQNPETEIYLVLQQGAPKNWLWWNVNYKSAKNNLNVRINANDGLVYDDAGNIKQKK